MADVKVTIAEPTVDLHLTWGEFEAVVGSLAVALPTAVVKWLNSDGRKSRVVHRTTDYADACFGFFDTLVDALEEGR